ncbi:MAG: FAD-dependent oxidoreductase [Pseudomonadota bacterium]
MEHFDVVIIGGGVIGLSLAWRLSNGGGRIAVIDAGGTYGGAGALAHSVSGAPETSKPIATTPGSPIEHSADDASTPDLGQKPPATIAAAGMLAPSFETERSSIGEALSALSFSSLARWPSFARDIATAAGVDIDFQQAGILGVAFTNEQADALRSASNALAANALASGDIRSRLLDSRETLALEPAVNEKVLLGLISENDGQVDPVKLLKALRIAIARRGVALIGDEAVHVDAPAPSSRTNKISIKMSKTSAVTTDRLVVAAGVWAGRLLSSINSPNVLAPVKGEALSLRAGRLIGRPIRAPGAYLCPKSDGRLVIGATEAEGEWTLPPDTLRVEGLRMRAEAAAPQITTCKEDSRWAGLRPATPDRAPILGPLPDNERILLALGHHRNGVLLAPETSEILSDHLLGNGDVDSSAGAASTRFSINRFSA